MAKIVTSQLQYKNYAVDKISVESNPAFKQSPSNSIDNLDIDFNVLTKGKEQSFLIELILNINKSTKAFTNSRYRISLKLLSIFEFSANTPRSEIDKLLVPNGLAMSYSTSRGIIGELTGNSINGKYVLPTVNFIELIKNKSRKTTTKLRK
jgi:preprotein translocase subunit SecB